jgi:hypothetical protein
MGKVDFANKLHRQHSHWQPGSRIARHIGAQLDI